MQIENKEFKPLISLPMYCINNRLTKIALIKSRNLNNIETTIFNTLLFLSIIFSHTF